MKVAFFVVLGLGIAVTLVLATQAQTPTFLAVRPYAIAAVLALALVLGFRPIRRLIRERHLPSLAPISLLTLALAAVVHGHLAAQAIREKVLAARSPRRAELARHLLVGFRDWDEARFFALELGVGGLFVTARNAGDLCLDMLAQEIGDLQQARASAGLPPLLIAADQEGGKVSRLSPPLPDQPTLGEAIADAGSDEALKEKARQYGSLHGQALSMVGVNLNLAPVADLKFPSSSLFDPLSRIETRAISADPRIVALAAESYSLELQRWGVVATAKHFPGLGRLDADTHFFSASLALPEAALDSSDWIPFRALSHVSGAVMLAHVRLAAVDRELPASLSPSVVSILRERFGFSRLLLTDDLCMGPIVRRPGGIGAAAAQALASGVDLLLVTYDPDQVFPALAGMLDADAAGRFTPGALAGSRDRLDHALAMPRPNR